MIPLVNVEMDLDDEIRTFVIMKDTSEQKLVALDELGAIHATFELKCLVPSLARFELAIYISFMESEAYAKSRFPEISF